MINFSAESEARILSSADDSSLDSAMPLYQMRLSLPMNMSFRISSLVIFKSILLLQESLMFLRDNSASGKSLLMPP